MFNRNSLLFYIKTDKKKKIRIVTGNLVHVQSRFVLTCLKVSSTKCKY